MVASAHNGGRLQLNFSDLLYGGAWPLINVVKGTDNWVHSGGARNGWLVSPADMDVNGYPMTSAYTQICFIPSQASRPGDYIVIWSGIGTIDLAGTIVPDVRFGGSDTSTTAAGGSYKIHLQGNALGGLAVGRSIYSPGSMNITVSGLGSPHVTNLRIMHENDYADYLAGKVWRQGFIDKMVEVNFGQLRFLDWSSGLSSAITSWSTRKSINAVSYGASEWRKAYWCGDTSRDATLTYKFTCAAPPTSSVISAAWDGVLRHGTTVQLNFAQDAPKPSVNSCTITHNVTAIAAPSHGLATNHRAFVSAGTYPTNISVRVAYFVTAVDANNVSLSLTSGGAAIVPNVAGGGMLTVRLDPAVSVNVAGTGEKFVYDAWGNPLSTPGNSYPSVTLSPHATYATMVYDSDLGVWFKWGGDRVLGLGLKNGAPYELEVDLCAALGAHPSWSMPHLAVDPPTDFIPELCLLAQTAPSWMIPAFEGPNETWNGDYPQTGYAVVKAEVFGYGTNAGDGWYGRAMSLIGQTCAHMYGGASFMHTKYKVHAGVQTVPRIQGGTPWRIDGTKYVGTTAPPARTGSWGTITYSAAVGVAETWRWLSNIAVVSYFSPTERNTINEVVHGFDYSVANKANASAQSTLAANYLATLGGAEANYNLAQCLGGYVAWQAYGQARHSRIKITCYEGGYSPDFSPGASSGLVASLSPAAWYSNYTAFNKATAVATLTGFTGNYDFGLPGITGHPGVVGMAVIVTNDAIAALNCPAAFAVTLSSDGSGNIAGANSLLLNQGVYFEGVTFPTTLEPVHEVGRDFRANQHEFSVPYYVVQTGNPFKVSATRGGAPVTFATAGSSVTAQACWFVTAVAGNLITLDVNSSGFSGTSTGGYVSWVHSNFYANNMRGAGKKHVNLAAIATQTWNDEISSGGEFPSVFRMSGHAPSNSVWAVLEDIFMATYSPQWEAAKVFNQSVTAGPLGAFTYIHH